VRAVSFGNCVYFVPTGQGVALLGTRRRIKILWKNEATQMIAHRGSGSKFYSFPRAGVELAKVDFPVVCSAGPGHQSPCAKARESLKTIGGYGLGKERRLRDDDGRQEPDHASGMSLRGTLGPWRSTSPGAF
jgi:hypothetical protein